VNVREIADDESNLNSGCSLFIFDLVMEHLARILPLFYSFNEKLATSHDCIRRWDNILKAPIHGIKGTSMNEWHPKGLGIITILSVEIGTCRICRVGRGYLIKLFVAN
jgi:hypothetical protein